MDYKGVEYLRRKLEGKRPRIETRYRYYEMKNSVVDLSKTIPDSMKWLSETLGWCAKSVDAMSDRLSFRGFRNDNYDIGSIYNLNNPDILFDSAVLSALISSCCFLYISLDDAGSPRLQVIIGGNATGILDPITNMLTEGYAVLERNNQGQPIREAYFLPGETIFYQNGKKVSVTKTAAPYPLLVPIIYRPDVKRPFGHSRITRACMRIQQSALRTLRRSEISAEFYSFPQKYVLGLSDDTEFDSRVATMSSFLGLGKDDSGDIPKVGQFTQQSMTPYADQMRMLAALFAGETGLTLDDLGFVTDNPSSAEAIKAAHETLRLTARKAQRTFGSGFLNAGYLAACVRDQEAYSRELLYETKPLWDPIFEPDAAMLSGIGDAIIKINQAVPGFFTADNLTDLTGIVGSN